MPSVSSGNKFCFYASSNGWKWVKYTNPHQDIFQGCRAFCLGCTPFLYRLVVVYKYTPHSIPGIDLHRNRIVWILFAHWNRWESQIWYYKVPFTWFSFTVYYISSSYFITQHKTADCTLLFTVARPQTLSSSYCGLNRPNLLLYYTANTLSVYIRQQIHYHLSPITNYHPLTQTHKHEGTTRQYLLRATQVHVSKYSDAGHST